MSEDLTPYGIEPVEEWPDLVPLDTPALPRIDLGHLPGWAGEYARALSESTETPPELAAGMTLATGSTAAARRLEVRVKADHCEPCNLWVVVALPPGNRKSAIQAATTRPLIVWEKETAADLQPKIERIASERQTLEVRIKYLRQQAGKEKDARKAEDMKDEIADLEASLPELPTIPQLWTSDATPERLGTLLSYHGECMAWLSSEGGVFDLLQGRYSNGIPNLDLVLKAHSGDAERVDRGSRPPVFLRRPRLSIGLSPQPDVLRGLASKPGFRGRGLLGRFLYLLPPSPLGYRTLESTPVPIPVREVYDAGIRAMLDWSAAEDSDGEIYPYTLELSAAAYEEWHAFAQAIEIRMRPSGDFEHFTDWAGKAAGAAARLAGVLHRMKHAHGAPWEAVITADTMASALHLMAVFARHSLAALDMMGADPIVAAARQVWEWIERSRIARFFIREAFNAHRTVFPRVQRVHEILDALEERGYVQIIDMPREGPGRPPSPVVRVRPEIVQGWR